MNKDSVKTKAQLLAELDEIRKKNKEKWIIELQALHKKAR